jgi:Fe-S oxidoreductase
MMFIPAEEEETCCGFGGTYSGKFPQISAEILTPKLDDFEKTGADVLVAECPGCTMQLRGGAIKRGSRMTVKHLSETLAENER